MSNKSRTNHKGDIVLITALTILMWACTAAAVPAEEWNRSYEGTANSAIQTYDGGYIVVGYASESYGNADVKLVKTDANGNLLWNATYGGSQEDIARSVQQTKDGGYIVAGSTSSYGAGPEEDAWIIKTDINGKELWNRTFGGKNDDHAYSIHQTPDEGYIIGGFTYSFDSDTGVKTETWLNKIDANGKELWNKKFGGTVTCPPNDLKLTGDGGYIIAGMTSRPNWGGSDACILKTDSKGNKQWNMTFGGTGINNEFYSIQEILSGGYIVAGYTFFEGASFNSALLLKIDGSGNPEWNKTYERTEYSGAQARSVQQTSDGGYILAGTKWEFELDSDATQSGAWLVKTDANGNEQWNKTFGNVNEEEEFRSIQQTSDGGYILAGGTWGSRTSNAVTNFWLVKVGPKEEAIIPTEVSTPPVAESPEKLKGESLPYLEEWNKTFGGPGYDTANSVRQTSDGGYILAGITFSYGEGNEDEDAWLIKTDANGNELWNETFERYGHDRTESVQQTSDGGYILVGFTYSSENKGGVTIQYPPDAWLIKTDANGNMEWSKTFGGRDMDYAYSVQQTKDGGFIIAGYSWSYSPNFPDAWLIKTDANGDRQWSKTYGGAESDSATFVQQTNDGGYIFVGGTQSYGTSGGSAWLVKTDGIGNELWNKTFGIEDLKLWDIVETEVLVPFWTESWQKTSDGGYIFTGSTWLKSGIRGKSGSNYGLLKRTDNNSSQEWNMTFGSAERFIAFSISDCETKSIRQTKDGGYILAGTTNSYGKGDPDAWLIKLKVKPESNKTIANITSTPTTTKPRETVGFEALFSLAIVLIVSRIKTKAT